MSVRVAVVEEAADAAERSSLKRVRFGELVRVGMVGKRSVL